MNRNTRIETESGECRICNLIGKVPLQHEGRGSLFFNLTRKYVPSQCITIQTYARKLMIECPVSTSFLTEQGWRTSSSLKVGDALCIKGVYVPFRYSVIKEIRRKRGSDISFLPPKGTELVANDIVVKI